MLEVFVYDNGKTTDKWTIIDKASDKVIQEIDDVMLFNATYKRYKGSKGLKGWHGILSKEINPKVIRLLRRKFNEIQFNSKQYYPQHVNPITWGFYPVKSSPVIKLRDKIEVFGSFPIELYEIKQYCEPWKTIEEDASYEYIPY